MPSRTASKTREGLIRNRVGSNGIVTLEQDEEWIVRTDTLTDDRQAILDDLTLGIPIAGATLNAAGMICKNVEMRPYSEHGMVYRLAASYSSEVNESINQVSQGIGNPSEWVPEAEVEFEPTEVVMAKDLDNKPYLNTVGDAFESGLVVIKRIPTRVFVQYEPINFYAPEWTSNTAYRFGQYVKKSGVTYQCVLAGTSGTTGPTGSTPNALVADGTVLWNTLATPASGAVSLDDLEDRCDTVNSVSFRGRPAKTLLLEVRKAAIGRYFGFRMWRIEYAMKYKKDGWSYKVLNMGYRYKNVSNSEAVAAGGKFFFQDKITGSHYLGKLNLDGTPVADQLTGDPATLEFRVFDETDFNTFIRLV